MELRIFENHMRDLELNWHSSNLSKFLSRKNGPDANKEVVQ
jgi:hypothetical protein